MLVCDYRTFLLALLPFLVAVPDASAQWPARSRTVQLGETPIYFPLAVGNTWAYEIEGRAVTGSRTVTVTEQVDVGGVIYYRSGRLRASSRSGEANTPRPTGRIPFHQRCARCEIRTGYERAHDSYG